MPCSSVVSRISPFSSSTLAPKAKINMFGTYLDTDILSNETFFRNLYKKRVKLRKGFDIELSFENFKTQISSFLYQKKINPLNGEFTIEPSIIFNNIQRLIQDSRKSKGLNTRFFDSYETLGKITGFREIKVPNRNATLTTHGWFELPVFDVEFTTENLSEYKYTLISNESRFFNNLLFCLPDNKDTMKYYLENIKKIHISYEQFQNRL